jgi:hypothetical protein
MRARFSRRTASFGWLVLALVASCGDKGDTVQPVALSDGRYRVAFARGYAPADEARVLAITARLDRTAGQLVLTLADGSDRTLALSPRPQSEWQPDCATMGGHVVEEVAELAPAPLELEALSFATPVVFPKCGTARMILADAPRDEATFVAFDLQ